MHFDTTRAHVEIAGGKAVNLVHENAYNTTDYHDFKGNFDLALLEKSLSVEKENISCIIITATCNSAGGQPISMDNMK